MNTMTVAVDVELTPPLSFSHKALDDAVSMLEDNYSFNPDVRRSWHKNPEILSVSIWRNGPEDVRLQLIFYRAEERGFSNQIRIQATGSDGEKLGQVVNDLRQFLVEEMISETK